MTVDEILGENPAEFLGSAQISLWNTRIHMELLRSETGNEENIFSIPFYPLLQKYGDKQKIMGSQKFKKHINLPRILPAQRYNFIQKKILNTFANIW